MSAYTPTLSLEVTADAVAEAEAAGQIIQDITDNLASSFHQADFANQNVQFTAERIKVIATGEVLEDYKAQLAAVFRLNGLTHVQTVTGEVIAIKFEVV